MRLHVQNVTSRQIQVALPGPTNKERTLHIDNLEDVSGTIERDASHILLRYVLVQALTVSSLDWPEANMHLHLGSPAAVRGLSADLRMQLGEAVKLLGRAAMEQLQAEALSVAIGDTRLSLRIQVNNVAATFPEQGGGSVMANAIEVRDVQVSWNGMSVRVGTLLASDIHVSWAQSDQTDSSLPALQTLHVSAASLSLGDIVFAAEGMEARVSSIACDAGFKATEGVVRASQLTIGQIDVNISDMAALARKPAQAAPAASAGAAASEPRVDVRILDRLHGHLGVDVRLDATVPVIGRRRATHSFRVDIDHGTFNYRQLERGLCSLEDAILDIELRDNKLIIERDIPIIRLRKDLIWWPLTAEDMDLAKSRRARLSVLPFFELPPADDEGDSALQLHKLILDNVAIECHADQGDTPALRGIIADIAAEALRVTGSLSYPPDGERTVAAQGQNLFLLVRDPSASATVTIAELAGLEGTFEAFRPKALQSLLRGITLTELAVRYS